MSETTKEDRDTFRVALNTGFFLPVSATRALLNDADRLGIVENRIQEIMEKCDRRGLKNGRNYGMEDVSSDLRAILISPNPREVSGESYK